MRHPFLLTGIALLILVAVAGCGREAAEVLPPETSETPPAGPVGEMLPADLADPEPEEALEDCPFECCSAGHGYVEKPCSKGLTCYEFVCQKPKCPFECCTDPQYRAKTCEDDYLCVGGDCLQKDTDSDGIGDVDERNLKTNPEERDTDGDGLNDYLEAMLLESDPTEVNTDGDRYDDGEDPDPTRVNEADIVVKTANLQYSVFSENLDAFAEAVLAVCTLPPCDKDAIRERIDEDEKLYAMSFDALIANQGDDYSSFVDFAPVIMVMQGKEKDIIWTGNTEEFGRLDIYGSVQKSYSQTLTVGDFLRLDDPFLLKLAHEKRIILLEDVRNIEYEEFP
ncbi:hypothetical protein JXB02_04545 [Candidatus Woesearchaeota archaeon]|nr:hypothetical protein [Candidatus Woesearchaeota archaeon]